MGFDVNTQGNSATVDLPPGSRTPGLPPKPSTTPASSTDVSRKPATVASSMSSTPISSGSGGYSLYSLIKKRSQNTPGVQRPAVSSAKLSASSLAKSAASTPVGVLKIPSDVAQLNAEKPSADSAMAGSHNAVSFANPVEKPTPDDENDSVHPQRFVLFRLPGLKVVISRLCQETTA